ncbi:WD40 repeat domain-containing protein [Fimbriiglobus ruber]|uniref:High-affnity carbon uptake protein Hat/HatR n=1 Tax=Fimbriiglobus ruber TaxID=1908690 RepID=A0A225DE93_9BACT|nr:hypothetical protein [Fimbriiglobus ruber]OWK37964.1 High-affnity carbon uptake protein Hat/HatR [Fimbriiglobus ruber]
MPPAHPDRRDVLLAGAAALAAGYADLAAAPVRSPAPVSAAADPPLPAGMIAQFGSPRFRCPKDPTALKLSPRGRYILAFTETALYIFETATGQLTGELTLPDDYKFLLQFPDEDTAVIPINPWPAGNIALLRVDLRSAAALRIPTKINLLPEEEAVLSPDVTGFVVSFGDRVRYFALPHGRKVWVAHDDIVLDPKPCFSPDGRLLAVAMIDAVVVYDVQSGTVVYRFPAKNGPGEPYLAFTPDGQKLAYDRSEMVVWTLATGNRRVIENTIFPSSLFVGATEYVCWTRTDQKCGFEATSWDRPERVRRFEVPAFYDSRHDADRQSERVVAANAQIAVTNLDGGGLVVWDTPTGKILPQSVDPPCALMSPCFGPTGRILARPWSPTPPAGWWSWDVSTGAVRRFGPWEQAWLSPDERYVARAEKRCAETLLEIELTGTTDGHRICGLLIPGGESSPPWFSGDGTLLAATDNVSHLYTRRLPGGRQQVITLGKGRNRVTELVDFSHTGRTAVLTSRDSDVPGTDQEICVVDVAAGEVLHRFQFGDTLAVGSISRDGTRFLIWKADKSSTGQYDSVIRIVVYDTATGTILSESLDYFVTFPDSHFPARFSPDNRAVVVPVSTHEVVVRELVDGGGIRKRFHTRGTATGAAFGPDGTALAITSCDAPLNLWDYRGLRAAHPAPEPVAVHRAWDDLTGFDAAGAFAAIQTLARAPDLSLPLIRKKLPPAVPVAETRVRQLVGDLGAPDYPTRARADAALRALGRHATASLKAEYDLATDPERRSRLAAILSSSPRRTPSQLRVIRAVEAVEWIGTPDAARLLRAWADGASGALLTTEAQAALRRLRPVSG